MMVKQTLLTLFTVLLLLPPLCAGGKTEEEASAAPASPAEKVREVRTFTNQGILFIGSEPIQASVYVDGIPQPELTPLMLRGTAPGEHTIRVVKEGYLPVETTVNIPEEGPPVVVNLPLTFPFIPLRMIEEEALVINGQAVTFLNEETEITLPEGKYSLQRGNDTLLIDAVYPKETLLKGVDFALITTLAFAGAMTAEKLFTESPGEFLSSPLTLSTYGTALLLTIFDAGLRISRNRFHREWKMPDSVVEPVELSARRYFDRGERYLAMGQLAEAYTAYAVIPREFPESSVLPLALHRLSRINILNGNFTLARKGFERILKEYPHPEVFDQSCQSLAQLFAREENWEEAVSYLNQMVFIDPRLDREEIQELKNRYLQKREGE